MANEENHDGNQTSKSNLLIALVNDEEIAA